MYGIQCRQYDRADLLLHSRCMEGNCCTKMRILFIVYIWFLIFIGMDTNITLSYPADFQKH
ncbi:hypothetical protein C0J52_19760 [Blattella germanica]|nr:hypothetical protein C0J52_19760 [Blattella germanica]